MDQYFKNRLEKIKNWEKKQKAYPHSFSKTHSSSDCLNAKEKDLVSYAGRVMSMRVMGKIAFFHLQDHKGKIQVIFKTDLLGSEEFKFLHKNIDIGDYLGISGSIFTTQKKQISILANKVELLSKALRGLPEKWHGLQDTEMKLRRPYLDLLMNEKRRKDFKTKNQVIRFFRSYLEKNDFFEVDTPILQTKSCGASARPFVTHHHSLDIDLYLRIAPEIYLKQLICGGYERVYEIGPCFRNEGMDPSHLQEFTLLEFYAAYWSERDNMKFIKNLLVDLVKEVTGSLEITYQGKKISFAGEWKEYVYKDLFLEKTKIDLNKIETFDHLKSEAKQKVKDIDLKAYVSYGSLADAIYKKYCRDHLIQPCFLTYHPSDLVPLARRNDKNEKELDIFQLLVNSWELIKAYSELVDPIEQKERLKEQVLLAKKGDKEAMMMDEDFITSMEYGMPPMSGLGIGIERLTSLLCDCPNIRDLVYFPHLRPEE